MLNDWSDKKTPLWFIMLPTGHEGPYSLEDLEKKLAERKLQQGVQVWREGLPVAISLQDVLNEIDNPSFDDDLPPPLPPLPTEDEEGPPSFTDLESYGGSESVPKQTIPVQFIVGGLFGLLLLFGLYQFMKDEEVFEIRRYPKMTLQMHEKIQKDLKFEGFDKKIFFHEYSAPDLTHIWLVTTGFQRCDVETVFRSVKDRLLSMTDEEVEFVSRSKLSRHVAELNVFEFRKGSKIVPGLYEMDVKAIRCEWEGIVPKIRNIFDSVEQDYTATMRVVLYPQGAEAFQSTLTALLKKKEEIKNQTANQEQLFWDDLQMKFQTLHAMTLQIEQYFLDFLDKGDRDFHPRLKFMIGQYTKKYGNALTEFVVSNEGYFDTLKGTDLRALLMEKDYEGLVRSSSKQIGMESMKVIEKLQKIKKPKTGELKTLRAEVLKNFERIKNNLTSVLLTVTEDRSKKQ